MKSLRSVDNFGEIDADSDSLLADCFEDHSAYESVISRRRFLILGRKGTGKTAIFRRLTSRPPSNTAVLGHTFADYPWAHHDAQINTGAPEAEVYVQSWTYLMLLSFARILINEDRTLPRDARQIDSLEALKRFVRDTYGTTTPSLVEFFSPKRTFAVEPELSTGALSTKLSVKPKRVPLSHLPKYAAEINRTLTQHVFRAALSERSYYVAFDELDLDFSTTDSRYYQRLIGLILAARRLNKDARAAGSTIFASIFLRSDVFDLLQFEDRNKVFETDASMIEWDSSRTKHSLKSLMERRFTQVLREYPSEKVLWDDVFTGEDMTSRRPQYQYILDRTFARPRDTIKFTNQILDTLKSSPNTSEKRIGKEHIFASRAQYSECLRRELRDEMFRQVPEWDRYLEVLKSIGVVYFVLEDFIRIYNRRKDELNLEPGHYDVLRTLFKFSIIGYARNSGGKTGTSYIFSYKEEPGTIFDETASQFRVHPGLIETLALSTRSDSDASASLRAAANESGRPDEHNDDPSLFDVSPYQRRLARSRRKR